jgi:N-acyl-phosphatidylethanolamine-hydrolysing phospholipase D
MGEEPESTMATSTSSSVSLGRVVAGAAISSAQALLPIPSVIPCGDQSLATPLVKTSRLTGRKLYDNPWAPGVCDKSPRELFSLLRTPQPQPPTAAELISDLGPVDVDVRGIFGQGVEDPMRVTWICHACILCQMKGLNIITDPALGPRAGPSSYIGLKRFAPPVLDVESLPRIDVVLLSHTHYDHLDGASARALGENPLWVVPVGAGKVVKSLGVKRFVEVSWWDHVELGGTNGVKVTSVPAQHWSNRSPFDRNISLWCGFVVESQSEKFYFAGDTGYAPIFRVIGERMGPFDMSAIPIGAYEPEWFMKPAHAGPGEAIDIHNDVRSKRSIAIHWGCFPLAIDGHADAPRNLVRAARERNMKDDEFHVLKHGESVVVGQPRSHSCRWHSEGVPAGESTS